MNPKNVSIDIRRCRCHAYHDVLKKMGFMLTPDNPNANIVWWDGSIPVEEFNSIKPEQHVNKIPGMDYLCYKSVLFNSLNQMQSLYPLYYDFYPKTYLLPQQFQEFQKEHQKSIARNESNFLRSKNRHSNFNHKINRTKSPSIENMSKQLKNDDKRKEGENTQKEPSESISTSSSAPNPNSTLSELPSINNDEPELPTWIVKPRSGCCGVGIRLIQNSFELAHDSTPSIVQKYVYPFLIDGHKFDFRFYLLITDLHPLSLFIYNEGIARFCTEKYEQPTRKNLNDKFIHITNTAINVENKAIRNEKFEFTRLASDVLKSIEQISPEKGGDVLWSKIKRISILTILALYPEIMSSVKNICGDILIDDVNNDVDINNNISQNKKKTSNLNEKPLTAKIRKQTRMSSVNPNKFYQSAAIRTKTAPIKSPETSPSSVIRPSLNQQHSQPVKEQNTEISYELKEISNKENNENAEKADKANELQNEEKNSDESNKKIESSTKTEIENENQEKNNSKRQNPQKEDKESSSNNDQPTEKEFVVTKNPIHRFFHLLGIDVMIDENCNPIVLELNDNPSMKITFPIERKLKPQLLTDEMSIVTLDGSPAPQDAVEKGGWDALIPSSTQPDATKTADVKDRHINSFIRSIQQRSMNIFGPSTIAKRNPRIHPRTASSKSRSNATQFNNSSLNNQSISSQNSISIESQSKSETIKNKTDIISNDNSNKLEPLAQPKKQKQNVTASIGASSSKVTKPIVHPKVKYSVTTEKTAKFKRTGYPRYYYQ